MISLLASVGRAQANRAGDVALVQACLKLATDKGRKSYFQGIANGLPNDVLWQAIGRFLEDNGFGAKAVMMPRSMALRALVDAIAPAYRFMRAVGESSVLHITKHRLGVPTSRLPTRHHVPFPADLSAALVTGLTQAAKRDGLFFSQTYGITAEGRFSVSLAVRDSQWVDPTSLRVSSTMPPQLRQYVANAVARPSKLFKPLEGAAGLTIVSRKAYPAVSKANWTASGDKRRLLGCKASREVPPLIQLLPAAGKRCR